MRLGRRGQASSAGIDETQCGFAVCGLQLVAGIRMVRSLWWVERPKCGNQCSRRSFVADALTAVVSMGYEPRTTGHRLQATSHQRLAAPRLSARGRA